jgi:2-(1,2-epoxy-1,2-dihydrophenyl)acetyl-CoA isomerase
MATYPELIAEGRTDDRPLVKVERSADRATVVLSDPPTLNALSTGLMVPLVDALAELDRDPEVAAVVLSGERGAFSAGGELRMIAEGTHGIRDANDPSDTAVAWRWIRNQFGGVVRHIVNSDNAFVAAIDGAAAGVGLAFALACDVLLASDRAVLVIVPHPRPVHAPGYGLATECPRAAGDRYRAH